MNKGAWLIGRWKDVPVFFHWTILLWIPWFYLVQNRSVVWIALSFPAFVLLLAAHEFGHAIAARRRKVHVVAIKLYVMHGTCEHAHPDYEDDHILIAWGGVLAQFVILIAALALYYAVQLISAAALDFLAPLFFVFIKANLWMAALNLIPVSPLDGYLAWRILRRERLLPFLRHLMGRLNFRQRRSKARESARMADELINRLKDQKT